VKLPQVATGAVELWAKSVCRSGAICSNCFRRVLCEFECGPEATYDWIRMWW